MKNVLFNLVFIVCLLSCKETAKEVSSKDCGQTYLLDLKQLKVNDTLKADVRVVLFDSLFYNKEYINNSIILLNKHFLNTKLKFELVSIDVIDNKDASEDFSSMRKHGIKYNKDDMFNIYIYSDNQPFLTGSRENVRGEAADIPSKTLGIRYKYLNTSTLTHELGHCLGLYHTHQEDKTNGLNTKYGDYVCDTHSNLPLINNECKSITDSITLYKTETCNIMSYIPPDCRDCFSEGQIDRIRFMVFNNETLGKLFHLEFNTKL